MYGKRPFFLNATVTVAFLPGASVGVFFPAILKSCETLPRLMTVKATVVPAGPR
jgi:hypothetical protein